MKISDLRLLPVDSKSSLDFSGFTCGNEYIDNYLRNERNDSSIAKTYAMTAAGSDHTDKMKELTHFRNGVEAVPSQLRRKQKIDTIPVRGRVRKKIWYLMDLTAINVRRIIRFERKKAQNKSELLCLCQFFRRLVKVIFRLTIQRNLTDYPV